MLRLSLVLLITFISGGAAASTWIGNGGSIMDTELRVTVARLKDAARDTQKHEDLCRCSLGGDQCALIRDLSADKVTYCSDFIRRTRGDFLKLFEQEPTVQWASEPIKNSPQSRDFDAIAQPATRTLVIDEARFAKMSSSDRLQLLAHEYLHFLGYKDEGVQGPFADGRQLLDTIGAALVVVATREGHLAFKESKLSRPFRNYFLWAAGGSRLVADDVQKAALYNSDSIKGSGIGITWYPRVTDNVGWTLGFYRYSQSESKILKSTLTQSLVEFGPEYRGVPFDTGMRFLDSIQLSAHLGVGYQQVTHELADDYVHLSESKNGLGALLNARLHVPLIWNFWLILEEGLVYAPYELSSLNIKNKTVVSQINTGVSYGFQF